MDLEKAYDHLNWDFLLDVLKMCGFRGKSCSWIAHCISSLCFLIPVNGSPIGLIISSRGLRQGDPFSPLLFVIVIQASGRMISVAVSRSLLSSFFVGIRTDISLLQFADVTLLFCGPTQIIYVISRAYSNVLKLCRV
jgi:hypothetical protein